MARVFIPGSADGLGRAAAHTLLDDGHEVVVHACNNDRLTAVRDLVDAGAAAVVGDLSDLEQTRGIAEQVNHLGPLDAVIHNAGVYRGPQAMPVNIVAPYLLTALIDRPPRLIYLSSSEHRSGRARLTGIDWSGQTTGSRSYPDSKLFATTLAAAVARLWPEVFSNAVDPGWVPRGWADPVRPTICGSGTSRRSGLRPARIPTRAPPGATGITSAASSPIPPSATAASRTSCSTTWPASPPRASPDPAGLRACARENAGAVDFVRGDHACFRPSDAVPPPFPRRPRPSLRRPGLRPARPGPDTPKPGLGAKVAELGSLNRRGRASGREAALGRPRSGRARPPRERRSRVVGHGADEVARGIGDERQLARLRDRRRRHQQPAAESLRALGDRARVFHRECALRAVRT